MIAVTLPFDCYERRVLGNGLRRNLTAQQSARLMWMPESWNTDDCGCGGASGSGYLNDDPAVGLF
jgi:hypothetical protein